MASLPSSSGSITPTASQYQTPLSSGSQTPTPESVQNAFKQKQDNFAKTLTKKLENVEKDNFSGIVTKTQKMLKESSEKIDKELLIEQKKPYPLLDIIKDGFKKLVD